MGYKVELKGIESVEGKDAYRVDLESPAGRKMTEYYDVESNLKVRSIITESGTTITQDYMDYKEVDGIKMPHKLKTAGAMPFPITLEVVSVEINKGIDDAVFIIE